LSSAKEEEEIKMKVKTCWLLASQQAGLDLASALTSMKQPSLDLGLN